MNKKQKFRHLFEDGPLEESTLFRPILMHFAARYIGKTYGEFASDHRVLVESNLRCLEDFDMDAVGLISDPYRETSAFGARVTFPAEAVPKCEEIIVRSMEDVRALKNPDVHKSERTRDRIEGARALAGAVGDELPLIGWVEGPLAEACDLAGVNEVMMQLMMDPDFVRALVDKVTLTAKDFARAQIEAGCDIIGVGDAVCSQIDTESYRTFVKDRHTELFKFIHEQGGRVKLHICGDITHLLEDIRDTGPDIVDIDHMVDLDRAHELLGPQIVRCGNLDPVSVIQQKEAGEVAGASKRLCEREKGRRFILSGGCEITVGTPPRNLRAMREAT